MKLTNRLSAIASRVPKGSTVADIGTDHAYIPVFLVQNNISRKIIASDIKKGPIERARKHICENGVEQYIETRLGGGLEPLKPNEADTIIIAGMGGVLIRQILINSPKILETTKRFILQPMIGQEVVREWLLNNQFQIVDEILAKEENKIYTIIVAEHGTDKVEDEIYYRIGRKLFENKDPLLGEFLNKKINKYKKIIKNLEGQNSEASAQRKIECEKILLKLYKLFENTDSNSLILH